MGIVEEGVKIGEECVADSQNISGSSCKRITKHSRILLLVVDSVVVSCKRIKCTEFHPSSAQLLIHISVKSANIRSHLNDHTIFNSNIKRFIDMDRLDLFNHRYVNLLEI